jgi:hypothetical protein
MELNENADWELVAAQVGEETVVEGTATQETSESLRREIEGLRVTTNRLRAETQRLTDRANQLWERLKRREKPNVSPREGLRPVGSLTVAV